MREDVLKNIEIALKMKRDNLSTKEISEKMNRPVGTIKRWLAPYQLEKDIEAINKGRLKGSLKMQENYALKRKIAYEEAQKNIELDLKDELLRDFINIYIGEGSKRRNGEIAVTNSDLKTILLCLVVMKKYFLKEDKKIIFNLNYYKDSQNEKELLNYWLSILKNNDKVEIRTYIQPTVKAEGHNNSNQYGLIKIVINDTYAKQKLNAYMDYIKEEWKKQFEETFKTRFIERE